MKSLIVIVAMFGISALAASGKSALTKNPRSKLSTDVRFGDHMVGGQYQVPMEALSVVENDKSIDDLIGVRKNFKDRIEKSKGFRAAQ